jgi:hypothetical protein
MPKVSEFFGISIYVYFEDHGPPHFHAHYAEFEALVRIADLSVIRGSLPPRALGLVVEWAKLRQSDLEAVWRQAQARQTLSKIPPLE